MFIIFDLLVQVFPNRIHEIKEAFVEQDIRKLVDKINSVETELKKNYHL